MTISLLSVSPLRGVRCWWSPRRSSPCWMYSLSLQLLLSLTTLGNLYQRSPRASQRTNKEETLTSSWALPGTLSLLKSIIRWAAPCLPVNWGCVLLSLQTRCLAAMTLVIYSAAAAAGLLAGETKPSLWFLWELHECTCDTVWYWWNEPNRRTPRRDVTLLVTVDVCWWKGRNLAGNRALLFHVLLDFPVFAWE